MRMHSSQSASTLNRIRKVPEYTLVIIGMVGLGISVMQMFGILEPLGVTTLFEEVLIGLLSLLVLSAGLERMRTLTPIKDSLSLLSETALGAKLACIDENVSLFPGTKLASKLDSIEATASQANRLREIGILAFYQDRRALPPFPDFIKAAKTDLLICALSADVIIQAYGKLLRDKLKEGCNIRFLLPEKRLMEDKKTIAHIAPQIDVHRTPDHLDDAIMYLDLLKKSILEESEEENDRGELQVKFLNFIPPMGFIMLDGDKNHARIRVEQYVYKCDVVDRPSYEVVPITEDGDLFSVLKAQFELCWKEASEQEIKVVGRDMHGGPKDSPADGA